MRGFWNALSAWFVSFRDEALPDLTADLADNLTSHLTITVVPLTVGLAISLPLAILLVRLPKLRYPLLATASVIQTVPSLALLALMVPILVLIGSRLNPALEPMGLSISALGFWPSVIALTLYSILPMLRNTVIGILGVDPGLTEAARGVGMTPRQVLTRVELPLAAPVIIAGIRTATVWVVGTATLATPVGQRCLGNYIFSGLQTQNWNAVLFGCVLAAALAVVLDGLIGQLQSALDQRNGTKGAVAVSLLVLILYGGGVLVPLGPKLWNAMSDAPTVETITVGSKTFTEQYILAEAVSRRLDAAGITHQQVSGLGSAVVFEALANDEIQVYIDYSGTIWANYMKRDETADAQTVLEEVTNWLARERDVTCLGTIGFENAYCLAMRRDEAERLRIRTIADLRARAGRMRIGGAIEFFERPEWDAIQSAYSLSFAEEVDFDPTLMYEAIKAEEVDVIAAFTSDGRIAAYDLAVLDDPASAIPPYDAILLLSPGASRRPDVIEALRPMLGSIDVEAMRQANLMVDRLEDKRTVSEAAQMLLDNRAATSSEATTK